MEDHLELGVTDNSGTADKYLASFTHSVGPCSFDSPV